MNRLHLQRAGYWLFVIGTLLTAPVSVWAQTTAVLGTITGVITDPSGAVVSGVAITVTNIGTQLVRKTSTNASGNYVLPSLPSGDYNVRAEKEGFEACENRGVHIDPAASVQINCAMRLGQVTQTVEVQAPTVAVQTTDAKVTRTVDSTQMTDLPVNGRNFVSLLGLQPGVVQSFSFNSFQAMSLFASQCTQVNGLTGESNNLLIDGTPSTRTRANGATVAMPSMDAISEVNIVTTGYMPEYSRAAGGQFAVNLKSGGDRYHGDVYEYVRNGAMDARNFFSSTVPVLDFNDFGFTIGGPVIPKHHKLYFFLSEEWQREVDGNTWTGTVPTAADRQGNLSAYCAVFGASVCPKVPAYLGGQTIGGEALVAGQPFPGDIIPSSLFSANGSSMVGNMYLTANTVTQTNSAYPYEGGYNFNTLYNNFQNSHMTSVKTDYIINDKNHLAVSVRHFLSPQGSAANGTGASSALINQGYLWPSRGASLDYTTTFSPTLLNDFSAGANEDINHINLTPGPSGNGLERGTLGIDFPYIISGGTASKDIAEKIPTLIMSGFDEVNGLAYPSGSIGHVYTMQDVVTKITGNHTLKAGVWWEHDGENDHDQVRVSPGGGVGNNLNGQFEFEASSSNPYSTGSPLADALLGNFDNYSELGWRNQTPWRAHQVGFFGQDSWKVTPHLTVQGGLRWDVFQPYSSKWNNFAMFQPFAYSFLPGVAQVVDPTTGFITGGNPYNGIVVPGTGLPLDAAGHFAVLGQELTTSNIASINSQLQYYGMARGLSSTIIHTRWDDFQPRLGFAWAPGDGKTSVRAGAGVFYNHNTLSDVTLEGGVTPYQLAEEVFNSLADCPGSAITAARTCSPSSTSTPQLPIPMTGNSLYNETPVVYSWNLSVEHMFWNNTLVSVGYVGNRARHMPINADLNQPAIGTFTNPANTGINDDVLRPYPGIGGDLTTEQEGNSKYDALQISVQRRLTKSLQYNVSYAYSKAFDMADSIYAVVTDTYNPKYNWQPAGFNQTHNLTTTWVYTLPFYRQATTWYGKAIGGWELSGDLAFLSGFQDSVTASGDVLGNGATSVGATEYAGVYPSCHYRGSRSVSQFFNTACFYQPGSAGVPTGSTLYGTVAPNAIEGPGIDNLDLALLKNGPITERIKYQFRAEFFNIMNHPSFNGIDTTVTDSTFGQVNSAIEPREIQLALKLIF